MGIIDDNEHRSLVKYSILIVIMIKKYTFILLYLAYMLQIKNRDHQNIDRQGVAEYTRTRLLNKVRVSSVFRMNCKRKKYVFDFLFNIMF